MRGLWAIVIAGVFGVVNARADSRTLVLTGINDNSEFGRIAGNLAAFSRANKAKFEHFFLRPGAAQPERGPEQVSARVRSSAAEVKPGETFLLFINDHGDVPSETGDVFGGGIDLPGGRIYANRKLLDDVEAALNPGARFVMIGTHCYSGGLHHVAFTRSNSCAAASTSHDSLAKELPNMPGYNQRVGEFLTQRYAADIDGDGKVSLYEAHLAAAIGDVLNDGRGQVSSAAFVDFELGAGAYAQPAGRQSNFGETLQRLKLGEVADQKGILGGMTAVIRVPGEGCPLPVVRDESLESFLKFVRSAGQALGAHLDGPKGYSPVALQPFAQYVRTALAAAEKQYGAAVKSRLRAYAALRVEYETVLASAGGMLSPEDTAKFTRRFDKLDYESRNELAVLWNLHQLAESMERVQKFYRSATPEKRQKLDSLISCETRPL